MIQRIKKLQFNARTVLMVLLLAFVFGKLGLSFQNQNIFRFSSDTQRHLYLVHEIVHIEAIPSYPIKNHTEFLPQVSMSEVSYYPRGFAMIMAILIKVTGMNTQLLINGMAMLLMMVGAGVSCALARRMFADERVGMMAALLFVLSLTLFNVTAHQWVAYIGIPAILYALKCYWDTNQARHLVLFILLSMTVQFMHSNYALMFLLILWAYAFIEGLGKAIGESGHKKLAELNISVLVFTSLYCLTLVIYYLYLDIPLSWVEFRRFFSGYTGIWSVSPNNAVGAMIGVGGLLVMVPYLVRVIWKRKRSAIEKFGENLERKMKGVQPIRVTQIWVLFMLLLLILSIDKESLRSWLEWMFRGNGDLGRLENMATLILFVITLFGLKEVIKSSSRILIWMYLPLAGLIVGSSVLFRIPVLGEPFRNMVAITFSVLDFSLVALCILAGYVLNGIIKNFTFRTKAITLAVLIMSLVQSSVASMYEEKYTRSSPDINFVNAYEFLNKNENLEGKKVGSNFEYLRAFTYVDRSALVTTMDERKLRKLSLDGFLEENDVDYFIFTRWYPVYPEERWMKELDRNPEYKRIYIKEGVQIYKHRS